MDLLRVAPVIREILHIRHQINQTRIVERRRDINQRKLRKFWNFLKVEGWRRGKNNVRDFWLIIFRLELLFGGVADVVVALRNTFFTLAVHTFPLLPYCCEVAEVFRDWRVESAWWCLTDYWSWSKLVELTFILHFIILPFDCGPLAASQIAMQRNTKNLTILLIARLLDRFTVRRKLKLVSDKHPGRRSASVDSCSTTFCVFFI